MWIIILGFGTKRIYSSIIVFIFSLIILYHVLSYVPSSVWEAFIILFQNQYKIKCIKKCCLFVGNFSIKILLFIAFYSFNTFSLHDNHFLPHKRSFKNNQVYWYFMYVLIMNLLLEVKLLQVIHLKDIEYFTGH